MATQYFIHSDASKDGPYDLVTIMRRIRAGKISAETLLSTEALEAPMAASTLPDTAMFFDRAQPETTPKPRAELLPALTLRNLLRDGWKFTADHSIMTVYAGGMVLLCLLLAAGLTQVLGTMPGATFAWVVFSMCYCAFSAACLRLFRGQAFSVKFLQEQYFPALTMLMFAGIVLGLMQVGGYILMIIPGLLVAMYYAFVPFLIYDKSMTLIEAMHASRLLLLKHRGRYQWRMLLLVLLYSAALALVAPAPLAMPLYVAALCRIYEELSAS